MLAQLLLLKEKQRQLLYQHQNDPTAEPKTQQPARGSHSFLTKHPSPLCNKETLAEDRLITSY